MPKYDIQKAELEKEDDDAVLCRTCSSPADERYEPYCMSCGMYWQDCENGLFDDPLCRVCGKTIKSGELCLECSEGNDTFFVCENTGKDLR